MPSAKVTTSSATKSVGVQTAAKSSEAFSINGKKISHSSSSITATNISDALEEVATQIAVQTTAPSSAVTEGDIWYDTDDDKLYVRDEDSWNELVSSISGTVDGGSY